MSGTFTGVFSGRWLIRVLVLNEIIINQYSIKKRLNSK
jgi:hypothetical protein